MPTYGVRITKRQGDVEYENRYFCTASDMDGAQVQSGRFVNFEKAIHGISVDFIKVNIWQIGASPRRHRSIPISGSGVIAGAFPTALEMTLKVLFGAEDSYPYYKEYRVAVNFDLSDTREWGTTYLALVSTALEQADEDAVWDQNTNKLGIPLADPTVQVRVEFSQLNKRHYNRTPTSP